MLKKRNFLPENLQVQSWENILPFYENLLSRQIQNVHDLRQWFRDRSELESMLSEDLAWRYIRMTCNTADETLAQSFNDFVSNIQPQATEFTHKLNEKCLQSPFLTQLEQLEPAFRITIRSLR
ncbi:MAG: M3 family oligoendopeptidase, partial [Raineya sp.]|nr:M3 family oligoendopeptidase [Raineya sp.]